MNPAHQVVAAKVPLLSTNILDETDNLSILSWACLGVSHQMDEPGKPPQGGAQTLPSQKYRMHKLKHLSHDKDDISLPCDG